MSISFQKSLLTPKVSNGAGSVAQYMRVFEVPADVNFVNVDSYGRGPISIYTGNYPQLSPALGVFSARYSPLYRIDVENAQRPQYSEYLNVPQGLMELQSEYRNTRPNVDLLTNSKNGGRSRAFGMDGVYERPAPPTDLNPSSEKDWMALEDWNHSRLVTFADNRQWVSAAAVQQAGGIPQSTGY